MPVTGIRLHCFWVNSYAGSLVLRYLQSALIKFLSSLVSLHVVLHVLRELILALVFLAVLRAVVNELEGFLIDLAGRNKDSRPEDLEPVQTDDKQKGCYNNELKS